MDILVVLGNVIGMMWSMLVGGGRGRWGKDYLLKYILFENVLVLFNDIMYFN